MKYADTYFDDWPDYLTLARRHVKKSRKPHTCWYCGQKIPVGSECDSETILCDGKVYTDYRHYPLTCGGGEASI